MPASTPIFSHFASGGSPRFAASRITSERFRPPVRGARRPGELCQWVFGEASVGPARQRELREQLLAAFRAPATDYATAARTSASAS